jgi:hypothetical protein
MKRIETVFLTSILAAFFAGMVFVFPVSAQENAFQVVKNQEVTLKDLGISDPGILPGNPFYFLKEWSRDVKSTLTFSSVKKAEVQLGIVNERAAEIKKLASLLPASSKSLTQALDNFDKSIDLLKEKIGDLEKKSASGSETDNFLNLLSDSIIKQVKLFSELKDGVGDKNKQKLSDLQGKAVELMAEIPLKIETPNEFKCRLEKVINDQNDNSLKEITVSEVLDRLDEKIPQETKLELLKIKENLLIKFQARLESEDFSQALSEILTQLPGDSARKVKILDEIREGVLNSDIKNRLNLVRQDILDKAAKAKEIRKPEAEAMINNANDSLNNLEISMNSTTTPKSVIISGLYTKAKFNLDQAKQALRLNNYGQAFGQASASAAASAAGLNDVSKFNSANGPCAEEDITSLKEYHDELAGKIKEMGLDKKSSPEIISLLNKSEEKIAKISDLLNKNPKADIIIPLLKEIRFLLSQLDTSLAK